MFSFNFHDSWHRRKTSAVQGRLTQAVQVLPAGTATMRNHPAGGLGSLPSVIHVTEFPSSSPTGYAGLVALVTAC